MCFRLTPQEIESKIRHVSYHAFGATGTTCHIELLNGYIVTGESACIDPVNFSVELGRKVAYDNAFNKLYGLLGYEVKQRWYEATKLTWRERVKLELAELNTRKDKLADMLSKGKPEYISEDHWELMQKQSELMNSYALVLTKRLEITE